MILSWAAFIAASCFFFGQLRMYAEAKQLGCSIVATQLWRGALAWAMIATKIWMDLWRG